MKNLFKTVLFAAIGAVVFVSCNSKGDDYDYEAEYLKQDQAIDALLSAQKLKIEEYVDLNFGELAQEDTLLRPFYVLDKKVKRGIWYMVEQEPTDNTYNYSLNSNGTSLVYPKVKLKYTAKLLTGEVVESDETGTDYNLGVSAAVIKEAWYLSFFPYSLKFNGETKTIGGLTKVGLKKGSKFKVVVPSIYAYGSSSTSKIPANSPLVYEFEVLDIQ